MRYQRPEPAGRSVTVHRGADDLTVQAQVLASGDLRLLSVQRGAVWVYSDIDTVAWWTWYTVGRDDLPRLTGEGGDILGAVRAAVAPDDNGAVTRSRAWLTDNGVPFTEDSSDERA